MRIIIGFQFDDESKVAAVTGVEGEVSDFILPSVGDSVRHRYESGMPFIGTVTDRRFDYNVDNGVAVTGTIGVTITLHRMAAGPSN